MSFIRLEEQLYVAISNGDIELVKVLLKQGANVNSLVHGGRTLLGAAVQSGDLGIVKILLEAENYLPPEHISLDCEETVSEPSVDAPDDSSVSLVSEKKNGNPNVLLVDAGNSSLAQDTTDVRCNVNNGLGLFYALRKATVHKRRCDVNSPDFYDRVPIHYAVESGNLEIINLLISKGCRVNVSDNDNITPLHLAVSHGNEKAVEILLKAGSRVNSKTSDKSSALHIAASRGYPRIIELLCKYGANVEILDGSDRTPLLLAITRSNHDVVKLLLSFGAKVNIEEIHGYTPLSEAIWLKDCELTRLVLEAGAKMTCHHHLLHYCVLHRCLSLCQLLIKHGAFLNLRDDTGDTPLHVAVKTMQMDVIELLLEHGSNPNIRSGISGQNSIHQAVESTPEQELSKFNAILQLLIKYHGHLNEESFTPGDTPLYRAIMRDKFCFAEELIRNGSDANLGNVYSCKIDNLCIARSRNHFPTVQLLVLSGFDLRGSLWLQAIAINLQVSTNYMQVSTNFNTIIGWLMHMWANPMTLSDLCRITIRRSMRENIVTKVLSLHTPMPIKQFLLFQNIDFVKDETVSNANADNAKCSSGNKTAHVNC